jgi:hypothetical protein
MMSDPDNETRPNQLNPNHDSYWQSRGEEGRPEDWEERVSGRPPADDEDDG